MRWFFLCLLGATLLALTLLLRVRPGDSHVDAAAGEVAAECWIDYHDDSEEARIVATVRFAVTGPEGARRIVIEPGAQGQRVAPVRGFRGIAGTNIRTARELGQLEEDARITIHAILTGSEGTPLPGQIERGASAHLPTRELGPDGRLRLDARTPDAPPLSLHMETPALPDGRWTAEVLVDDRLRLAVDAVFDGDDVQLLDIRGADPPDPLPVLEHTP